MMESLLDIILKSEVSAKEVISWLHSSNRLPILDEFETLKAEFVPYFLNYLREETSSIIKNCSHTGFTPNKLTSQLKPTKHSSPSSYLNKSSNHNNGFCSKAKTLNFTDVSLYEKKVSSKNDLVASKANVFCKTPERNLQSNSFSYNESPVTSLNSKYYKTSTPRVANQKVNFQQHSYSNGGYGKSEFGKVSERKNVLADFIVSEPSKKSQKKKNHKNSQKNLSNLSSNEVSFNLEDTEAFPAIGSQNSQKKKRINPTRVVSCQETSELMKEKKRLTFGVPSKQNRNNPLFITTETKSYSLDQERKLLREDIDKMQKFDKTENPFMLKMNSLELTHNKKCINTIHNEESLSFVTNKKELQILADIYSNLILFNMVPNIMVELYFLLQLLTTEEKLDDKFQSENIFTSFNCIFFSVKTLSLLLDCLSLLDRNFLKALSDNPRIKAFDIDFTKKLLDIIENFGTTKHVKPHSKSPILSVSFQSETDNKNNFPDTLTFQTFKKQRDLFYEVLRLWEDGHLTPGWSFEQNLGMKVKQIFSLQTGLTNLTHLARLFQSQLLTMCKGDQQLKTSNGAEDMSFLWQLKKQHPEKYRRLFDRLITPSQFGGPVPVPSFPGSQEFFKNFIIIAFNHSFNTHLRNVLVMKITELNERNCQISELEDKDHGDQIQDEVSSGIQSLCLLAKFLGFLEFLPYQTSDKLPDIVLSSQLALRNTVIPPIPLLDMLKYGVESGCLIVVVPWIVELLSMVDSVALHTRYYLTLIYELILIYKILYLFRISDDQNTTCDKCNNLRNFRRISYGNSLLMKLRLGWLFSLPNVPEGLFFVQEEEADVDTKELDTMKRLLRFHYLHICYTCVHHSVLANFTMTSDGCEELDVVPLALEDLSPSKNSSRKSPMKSRVDGLSPLKTPSKFLRVTMIETPDGTPDKIGSDNLENSARLILDSYDLMDCSTLLMFCPFVHELKSILNDFQIGNVQSNNGVNIRKITPLSAPEKAIEMPKKTIQSLLEENFFHNQPSSTKKTVDFLVERVFSNVLRSLRSDIIPKLKDDCVVKLRSLVNYTVSSISSDKASETVDKHVQELSNELSTKVRQEIIDQMNVLIEYVGLQNSLQYLLPVDISKNSYEMCCQIVKRTVQEKVMLWINSHITTGFCNNELATEAHKYLKQAQKQAQNNDSTNNFESSSFNCGNNCSLNMNNSSIGRNSTLLDDQQSLDASSSITTTGFNNVQPPKSVDKEFIPRAEEHNAGIILPSRLLSKIKLDLKYLMIPSEDFDSECNEFDVEGTIMIVKKVLEERQDVTFALVKALQALCTDWLAALCVSRPDLINNERMKEFLTLWKRPEEGLFPDPKILCVLFSARTIMLLGQKDIYIQTLAWKILEEIAMEIVINFKLITVFQIQETFISLLRHEWPKVILEKLSHLVKNLVDVMMKSKDFVNDVDALQFMDWVGWFTSDIEL